MGASKYVLGSCCAVVLMHGMAGVCSGARMSRCAAGDRHGMQVSPTALPIVTENVCRTVGETSRQTNSTKQSFGSLNTLAVLMALRRCSSHLKRLLHHRRIARSLGMLARLLPMRLQLMMILNLVYWRRTFQQAQQ